MNDEVITEAGRPDLIGAMRDLGATPWPEFLGHDEVVRGLWDDLYQRFPDRERGLGPYVEPNCWMVHRAG
jgi:hypothetical protein